nr:unnamed protein product [Digitaria exilis]
MSSRSRGVAAMSPTKARCRRHRGACQRAPPAASTADPATSSPSRAEASLRPRPQAGVETTEGLRDLISGHLLRAVLRPPGPPADRHGSPDLVGNRTLDLASVPYQFLASLLDLITAAPPTASHRMQGCLAVTEARKRARARFGHERMRMGR